MDNLRNFQNYIRQQAEALKKYAKEKDVKKDLFLIVPVNTLEVLETCYYNMANYNVYILPPDAIEPIILTLLKIEEYELAEELSPDNRDKIYRIMGKFAHATKRRSQVDLFFIKEFMNIIRSLDELPEKFKGEINKIEVADKINPPMEKRVKSISEKDIENDKKRTEKELEIFDVKTINNIEFKE